MPGTTLVILPRLRLLPLRQGVLRCAYSAARRFRRWWTGPATPPLTSPTLKVAGHLKRLRKLG
eukprot:6238075-Alexandrium_andersonii.AAC.1